MKNFINRHRHAIGIGGIGLAISYGLLVGKPAPEMKTDVVQQIPTVETFLVNPKALALTVKTQGTVEPRLEIQISSQVSGLITSTSQDFFRGSYFSKNETMIFLEQADYEYAIAKADSQLAAARQRVAEEKGRALQARRQWQELGSTEANALFLREPQLAAAKAQEYASLQELEAANRNLERTKISMPFNGRILEKFVDVGEFVGPGTRLAQVYATDVVQVRLPLTDRQVALLDLPLRLEDIKRLNVGEQDAINVVLGTRFGGELWTWAGKIVRTEAQIDVKSRLLYAVAEIENPLLLGEESGRPPLSPGMFVSAEIQTKTFKSVAVLPRNVLRNDSTILIVNEDNRVNRLPITILESNKETAWISGLKAGTRVIIGNSASLSVGKKVVNESSNQLAQLSDKK